MENQVSSKSIMLNYGLVLGVISVLIHLTFYASGSLISLGWLNGVLSFAVMITVIVLGIKKIKELNGGFLTFGEAIKTGVGIAIIAGVISVIYTLIFNNFIDPDFQLKIIEVQKQAYLDSGMSEEQIEGAMQMAEKFKSPVITSAIAIVASAFFGFIFSAIAGAIMKKSQEEQY